MNPNDTPPAGPDPLAFLAGGGEMGERTRALDWSKTPAGPAAGWPQSLKSIARVMLDSRYAMWLGWGPDFTFFYNDAYARMTLGPKHPWALGRPAREVWPEIWAEVGPRAESVLRTGRATWDESLLLFLERRGFKEESFHTFSYSPVPDDGGEIGGMLCVVTEDTERTIGERRLRTLRELAARTTGEARSAEDACRTAARTLAGNPRDVPFALLYLLDGDGRRATLAGRTWVEAGAPAGPAAVDLAGGDHPWPFRDVADTGRAVEVRDLPARFGPLPGGAWPEPAHQAVVLPMAKPGQGQLAGFVVAGVSPRRPLDDGYRGFLDLLAGQVATAVANARAYEEERRRAEELAELDRAKTAFFSNVSHEFRTPLTLMLGPVEDLLAKPADQVLPEDRALLEVVGRNGRRLMRLVNTLLDFSRIEAGRVRASYEPTDLAALTADLASNFRSACDRAGLRLVVDCPPLGEPALVDRQMWEKVVLNLLSNAFKFTFEGEIRVEMRGGECGAREDGTGGDPGPAAAGLDPALRTPRSAILTVRDTGTGIPAEEMPRLFERFHRVENAKGRTHEGSGIGLALVQELVKLHGGTVAAASAAGRGTAFTVTVPLGSAHLPADRIVAGRAAGSTAAAVGPYVEEALRWLPEEVRSAEWGVGSEQPGPAVGSGLYSAFRTPHSALPRVLVADDNADMRRYVARLLAGQFEVEAVADGEAALAAARDRPPELVLSDVMMPRLDGFGLLRALRADPRTRGVPVVLLSARAGEESRVEGVEAGADDYLVKPFSAKELLARVTAQVQMARLRREANESLRAGEERLRMALTAARMVAWQYDPATGRVAVSDNAADVFGLPPGTALEHSDQGFALVHPDDVGRHRATVAKAVAECGSYVSQFRMTRGGDGAVIWLEERGHGVGGGPGEAVRLVGVVMDITDRKRAEARVAEGERRFRTMVEQVKDYAIFTTDPGGRATSWNEGVLRVLGFAEGEWVGRDIVPMIFTPEDVRNGVARAELDEAAATGRASDDRWMMRKGGERFFALGVTTGLKDEAGKLIGYTKVMRDRTEQHRTENELRRVAAELSEADRRKDEFLSILAHELRNPLAPIRNGLQLMKLAKGSGPAVEQARAMMERQLGQMVHLIDDLMDLTRISRGKVVLQKTRMPLAAAVRNAVETSSPLVEAAGHALAVALPDEPIYVDADEVRLSQVLANLLNNAAKYTERGGRIRVAVGRDGGEAVVSVEDTGVGIPAPMLPRVFDMFTQVDRSLEKAQGGLGIGLSIVKRLVEMHGGTVEARSGGHGLGSTFTVRLPAAPPPAGGPAAAAGGRRGPAAARRVLVVDDNRDGAASLAELLGVMGNETRTAHDGVEAVAAAAAFRPDVILMDIGMPKLNGYEACRRIRGQAGGGGVVIVACTGWGQDEDKRRAERAGFDFHLVKPVDPAALEQLLSGLNGAAR